MWPNSILTALYALTNVLRVFGWAPAEPFGSNCLTSSSHKSDATDDVLFNMLNGENLARFKKSNVNVFVDKTLKIYTVY